MLFSYNLFFEFGRRDVIDFFEKFRKGIDVGKIQQIDYFGHGIVRCIQELFRLGKFQARNIFVRSDTVYFFEKF